MASNKFQIKRTTVAGKIPNTSVIDTGELAVNLTDQKLYTVDQNNTVFQVAAGKLVNLADIDTTGMANGQVLAFNSANSTFVPVTALTSGAAAFGTVNADGVAVSASVTGDTLNFTTDSNLDLTSNTTTKTIDIALGNTGTPTGTFGNTTAIPVVTVDEKGRITNVTTSSISGVTNVSYVAANSTLVVSTSTTDFPAQINAGNSSVQGLLKVVDSVSNTSDSVAASANSVKTAYDAAIAANTRAASAEGQASNAYSNAITFAANASNLGNGTVPDARLTKANTSANGVVTILDSVANTSTAGYAAAPNSVKTAYDAAISANTRAASAEGQASNAYSNAITFAANASNLGNGTVPDARLTKANTTANGIVTILDSISNTTTAGYAAAPNSVKTAYDAAISANTRAASAEGQASNAYSNAVTFAANASNLGNGTVPDARLTKANTSANGIVTILDSVSNTTTAGYAAAPNSVKTAYDAAIAANNRAASAQTAAASAYSNAVSYVDAALVNTSLSGNTTADKIIANTITTAGGVTVGGDLIVQGNTISVTSSTMSITDNMVYMNQGIAATITNISGNGTVVTFTANNNFANGWDVAVYGVTPTSYNGTYNNILTANATHFTVSNTNTAAYTSGGTARGKADSNPDIGFAAGYNDGTYHHTGIFRDATDGRWKPFDNYTPEPDVSIFIDTTDVTFHLADIQANTVYANVSGNVTGTASNATNLNSQPASYYTNASNLSTGTVSPARLPQANSTSNGAVLILDSVSNTATSIYAAAPNSVKTAYDAAIAANNRAASAEGQASNAYSNATTFAANASNLGNGTVPAARLPIANSTVNGAVMILDSVSNTSVATYAAAPNSVKTAYDAAITANTNAANASFLANGTVPDARLTKANTSANGIVTILDSVSNTSTAGYAAAPNSVKTAYDAAITANTNAANASFLSSGTVASARLPVANSSVSGAVTILDSVSNTSVATYAAAPNSVKNAYDAAITANTNAANASFLSSGTVASARLPVANSTVSGAVTVIDSVSSTLTAAAAAAPNSVKTAYDAAIAANTLANTALDYANTALTAKVSKAGDTMTGSLSFDDVSRYWLNTATNWGLYWNTTDNTIEFHGAGTNRASVDLDNGRMHVGATGQASYQMHIESADDIIQYINKSTAGWAGYTNGHGLCLIAPSMTAGSSIFAALEFGQARSSMNDGHIDFIYNGAGSTSNFVGIGLYAADKILNVTGARRVGINTETPGYDLHVNGSFAATTKSFLIDHPTKPGMKLRYGSLEGPENGVYVRGKLKGGKVIELPDYWTKLVDPESITVQLTPIGKHQKLYVEDIRDNKVFVANDGLFAGEINCFYYILAERNDVDKLGVEIY